MMMHEFFVTLAVAISTHCFSAWFYEHAKCEAEKWIGRAGILTALIVMITFSYESVRQCDAAMKKLAQSEVKASNIATHSEATDYSVTLSTGQTVSWSQYHDRRTRSLPIQSNGFGSGGYAVRSGPGSRSTGRTEVHAEPHGVDGRNGKPRGMQDAKSLTSSDAWSNANDAGTAF